jgi:hypothetical protein
MKKTFYLLLMIGFTACSVKLIQPCNRMWIEFQENIPVIR